MISTRTQYESIPLRNYKHCDSQATARIVEFQLFLAQPRTLERGSVDYIISKFNIIELSHDRVWIFDIHYISYSLSNLFSSYFFSAYPKPGNYIRGPIANMKIPLVVES
jgi:hypothetical protein